MQRVAKCEARQASNECSAAVREAPKMQWRKASETREKEERGAKDESKEPKGQGRNHNCEMEEKRKAETNETR